MGYWLAAALLLGLASLTAARYVTSARWVDALFVTAAFLGLAAGLLLGVVTRRAIGRRDWKPVAALILAVAAGVVRSSLLLQVETTAGPRPIELGRIVMACGTVVWAGLALLWGTLGVSDATSGKGTRWGMLLTSAGAVALALFSLAPLWATLGLRFNHLTLLGLFGLACVAYLAGRAYQWVGHRLSGEATGGKRGKKD